MSCFDRLSCLLNHFEVRSRRTANVEESNLLIIGQPNKPEKLTLFLGLRSNKTAPNPVLAFASIDLGGVFNPLLQMVPETIEIDLTEEKAIKNLALLIITETERHRCGGEFALGRLCDLIVVAVLRHSIEKQNVEVGILAGLAHPRLSSVIVAIHEDLGKHWRIDDFTDIANMSRSQFMNVFQNRVGMSPMSYLKLWRMTAARVAILKGEQVKAVAARFGYRSSDAFSRVYRKTYGILPSQAN
ncbi:AraC family transcriptional regulator [Alteromonadaceae bacterium M269]|nr:AraC family transcriptional regulator [Alteromonadaceae bacterium M269]